MPRQSERSLELELDKTRIRAPFSGVVARRYVRQGQQVAKGDRLFWVTAEGPLRMRFTLPEKFIGQIQKGQELPMTTPDLPDQKYKVRVVEVSPVVDPASSTIEVTVELAGKTRLAPARHGRERQAREPAMNITEALNEVLPEIPARMVSRRYPRLHPDIVFKEHILEGQVVVRVFVPGVEALFTFTPQNWQFAQLFNGQRSYEEIADLYFQETGSSIFERRRFVS